MKLLVASYGVAVIPAQAGIQSGSPISVGDDVASYGERPLREIQLNFIKILERRITPDEVW